MLACDAQIIPAVLGTRSELLDLGHAHRLAKPGLATALELRDKTCTYPGCRIPAAWTDKHHITHWANGGPTTKGNMCCLCRHHHTVVHRHGHIATVTPYGVTWTRADGTPIGNQPRPDDDGGNGSKSCDVPGHDRHTTDERDGHRLTGGGSGRDGSGRDAAGGDDETGSRGSEPLPAALLLERRALPSEQFTFVT